MAKRSSKLSNLKQLRHFLCLTLVDIIDAVAARCYDRGQKAKLKEHSCTMMICAYLKYLSRQCYLDNLLCPCLAPIMILISNGTLVVFLHRSSNNGSRICTCTGGSKRICLITLKRDTTLCYRHAGLNLHNEYNSIIDSFSVL